MKIHIAISLVILAVAAALWPATASAQQYDPRQQQPYQPGYRYPPNVRQPQSFTFTIQARVLNWQRDAFQVRVIRVYEGGLRRGDVIWIDRTGTRWDGGQYGYGRRGLRPGQLVKVEGQVHRLRGALTYTSTSIVIM